MSETWEAPGVSVEYSKETYSGGGPCGNGHADFYEDELEIDAVEITIGDEQIYVSSGMLLRHKDEPEFSRFINNVLKIAERQIKEDS